MKEIKITSSQENQTIFKFVKKYLSNAPLSFIEKIFRKKLKKAKCARPQDADGRKGNVSSS